MTTPQDPDFKPANSLKSGGFYMVQAVYRCYRINEPDHFRKDLEFDLFGYFDKEDRFHHFNRLESRIAATSTLEELFSLPDLRSIEFYELNEEQVRKASEQSGQQANANPDQSMPKLIGKTVQAFMDRRGADSGVEYSVEELKRKHMGEFLAPPELAR